MRSVRSARVGHLGVEPTSESQNAATRAWCTLSHARVAPLAIEILQEFSREPEASVDVRPSIYRLIGIGPEGSNVIAKQCDAAQALREWKIYETVLAEIPVHTPRCYGLGSDEDERLRWVFLEDAGDAVYSLDREDHRVLAGQWLGLLNVSAHRLPAAARLPNRSAGFYRELLLKCQDDIRDILDTTNLGGQDTAVLRAAVSHCCVLEEQWHLVEQVCDALPSTLVHGDFAVQNARLRIDHAGTSLCVFDWEGAGWGTPAIDLAQFIGKALSPDMCTYVSVVSQSWPGVAVADVERLALFGRMLRLVTALEWANWGFKAVNTGWYMEKMRWCERTLADWIKTVLQAPALH